MGKFWTALEVSFYTIALSGALVLTIAILNV